MATQTILPEDKYQLNRLALPEVGLIYLLARQGPCSSA